MAKGGAISFTLSCEGVVEKEKEFDLKAGSVVRIGRSPVADLSIEHRGISQYHAELRLLPDSGLCVRDLSSNGTGLKRPGTDRAICVKKDADEPVADGAQLLIPMRVKENHSARAWIKVALKQAEKDPVSPAGKKASSGSEAKSENGSGSDQDADPDAPRKHFVELLLKTREISGGTTYEEAEKLLSHESAWKRCEDDTRKECFKIFVDHLGDTGGKKKGKKKDKDKGGKKKDKDKKEKKGSKKRPASSPEAGRRNGAKKKRRSGSRQSPGASGSRSNSRRGHRRRPRSASPGSA